MREYIAVGILSAAGAWAQSAPPAAFDVASIKPDTECRKGRTGSGPSPGRLDLRCTTLEHLIQTAYIAFAHSQPDPTSMPIVGGPAWMRSDRYDVQAKAEGNASFTELRGPMLRALLEDRFQVKVHRETKEGSVYTLTVAKGGAKIKPIQEGDCIPVDLNHPPPPPARGEPLPNYCGTQELRTAQGHLVLDAHGISLADLAKGAISDQLDHPAIDRTGLTGLFNIHLEFAPSISSKPGLTGRGGSGDAGSSAIAADSDAPSIFTALVEQLGLKLESGKGPVEVLVIDHAERPTAN